MAQRPVCRNNTEHSASASSSSWLFLSASAARHGFFLSSAGAFLFFSSPLCALAAASSVAFLACQPNQLTESLRRTPTPRRCLKALPSRAARSSFVSCTAPCVSDDSRSPGMPITFSLLVVIDGGCPQSCFVFMNSGSAASIIIFSHLPQVGRWHSPPAEAGGSRCRAGPPQLLPSTPAVDCSGAAAVACRFKCRSNRRITESHRIHRNQLQKRARLPPPRPGQLSGSRSGSSTGSVDCVEQLKS